MSASGETQVPLSFCSMAVALGLVAGMALSLAVKGCVDPAPVACQRLCAGDRVLGCSREMALDNKPPGSTNLAICADSAGALRALVVP